MRKIVLMVGLPRSGKTTIARELVKQVDAAIVNPDSIRRALYGHAYYQPGERFVWATAHTMADALLDAGHSTVIIDACNISRKRRDEWKRLGCDRYVIELLTTAEVCHVRNGEDGALGGVIDRMASNYEEPNMDEGFVFWTFSDSSAGLRGWSDARQGDVIGELMAAARADVH